MYDLLKEMVKPELLILIPVLYLVGTGLKVSSVSDRKIPYILGAAGVILSALYLLSTAELGSVRQIYTILFMALTQGILCAGASVYVNQLVKQAGKEE